MFGKQKASSWRDQVRVHDLEWFLRAACASLTSAWPNRHVISRWCFTIYKASRPSPRRRSGIGRHKLLLRQRCSDRPRHLSLDTTRERPLTSVRTELLIIILQASRVYLIFIYSRYSKEPSSRNTGCFTSPSPGRRSCSCVARPWGSELGSRRRCSYRCETSSSEAAQVVS